jgi:prohibitin 1
MDQKSSLQIPRGGCLGIVGAVVLIVLFKFAPISMVPAGHVGVLTVFGRVTGQVISEGINLVSPLAQTHLISIRTQEVKETTSVPSNEGLILRMDTSLLYHVDAARAADLYQKVGQEYVMIIVEPLLRSSIREATAENSASTLYTGGRELVAKRILDELRSTLGSRGILVENVLLRDIQLPDTLRNAIEAKQKAEQDSEKAGSGSQTRRSAGDRGLPAHRNRRNHEQLLEWRGIEARRRKSCRNLPIARSS